MAKDPYKVELETASPEDVSELAAKQAVSAANTQTLGRILSYDPSTQRASVQPILRAQLKGEAVKIPVISGVPVMFPSGGGFSITWPLSKGDEGSLVFIDRSIDEWNRTGGKDIIPKDLRRFDLSDAVFVPGLRPLTRPLNGPDGRNLNIGQEESTVEGAGPRRLTITEDGRIRLGDDQGNDIVSILHDLCSAVLSSQHGPYPLDPATTILLTAMKEKLATLKVD